jgi:glycosyltransferase involved in cell wall biosynthesis
VVQVVLEVEPWTLRDKELAADDRERGVPLQSIALADSELEERLSLREWSKLQVTGWSVNEVIRAIDSYDLLVANSRFTKHWIEQRWERSGRVIYPTVNMQHTTLDQSTKLQHILSVGRFFEGGHNKQHLAMIRAFRKLYDSGLRDWQYHLVGGCDLEQPEQRHYLQRVQQAAQNYPIMVHVNAPLTELQQRYREASIFWHAAGLDVDETRVPDNVEHFGITAIEAMAASCVPVVVAKGGLTETVEAEQNGLLWHSLDELKMQTQRLINDAALRSRLAEAAYQRSLSFRYERFANDVQALLTDIGADM